MDLRNHIVMPELVWTGDRFERGVAVSVDACGQISLISPANMQSTHAGIRLPRRALLPGFVNAHSHAFQIGLRGTPQRFDTGSGNFWSWRETMYRLAESLDVDGCYEHSRRAFAEMLAAGMTTVGEFHYLHHPEAHAQAAESRRWAFDDAVLSAARDSGIRLVLIQTFYATGGIEAPLAGAQQRFGPVSRDLFLRQLEQLAGRLELSTQSLALACHSIRAVALDDLRYFRDVARANGWPFHIHVEEVRREIDDCRAAYGRTPMRVLLDEILIDQSVTAIHCTHSAAEDLREWIARGASICLCPITEGNLSDGFADVPEIRSRGGKVCFGTDCNIRLCAAEEMRMLEFVQRLCNERRGVVIDAAGRCAPALLQIGTAGGAHALGVQAGTIEAGQAADCVTLDLDHPLLSGAADDAILDAFVFGCGNEPIDHVWVGGTARRGPTLANQRFDLPTTL